MAKIIGNHGDATVAAVAAALEEYEVRHPGAQAAVYRQNPGAIRARVVDDRFAGMSRSRRHDDVWTFLESQLGEDLVSEISSLLLLPNAELRSSLANLEFEDPLPSGI